MEQLKLANFGGFVTSVIWLHAVLLDCVAMETARVQVQLLSAVDNKPSKM